MCNGLLNWISFVLFSFFSFMFVVLRLHCTKNHIFVFQMLWKDGFSKNMIFLILSEKMIFLFLENIILFFRRKMKDDPSQKKKNIYGNMIFSSNVLKRWSFLKNSHGLWSFLYYLERWYLFLRKLSYFFFGRKIKDDLSQEIHGNMILSVYMYKCYKYDITLLPKKS